MRDQRAYRAESNPLAMNAAATILFRCDASVDIGTGHFMRCLALAQAWQSEGGQAIFAMAEITEALQQRAEFEGFELRRLAVVRGSAADSTQVIDIARRSRITWIVVDGYAFGADYQLSLKMAGFRLLFFDDNGHAARYSADYVLNQNAHAAESLYQDRDASTRLLLGSRYVLLRREFANWRSWKREIPEVVRKVLITMGGSDPDNVTDKIVRAISSDSGFDAVLVVGGSYRYAAELRQCIRDGQHTIRLVENATDMAELMANADLAVSAAGTTCWELCRMGLPSVVSVLADNQRNTASALQRLGVAVDAGSAHEMSSDLLRACLRKLADSPAQRMSMSERGRELVDGYGTERVLSLLQQELTLKKTVEADCRLLWEWANDPLVRAVSFSQAPISWEAHCEWFSKVMSDPNFILYTASKSDGSPVGQVRFNVKGPTATVSISVDRIFRGRKYGRRLVFMATEKLFQESRAEHIDAYVKTTNEASLRMFATAGFRKLNATLFEGHDAIIFRTNRHAV